MERKKDGLALPTDWNNVVPITLRPINGLASTIILRADAPLLIRSASVLNMLKNVPGNTDSNIRPVSPKRVVMINEVLTDSFTLAYFSAP